MSKLIAAAVLAAGMWTAPPLAHADGACTAMGNTDAFNGVMLGQYMGCVQNAGGSCHVSAPSDPTHHVTCTYADNSRDECTVTGVAGTRQWSMHDYLSPRA
jgi:hypothetical protein